MLVQFSFTQQLIVHDMATASNENTCRAYFWGVDNESGKEGAEICAQEDTVAQI